MPFLYAFRESFRGRHVRFLNDLAKRVTLVHERCESHRGNFVYPGSDYVDLIAVDHLPVGYVDYGINPLGDRLYINMIEVKPEYRRHGAALAALWLLQRQHGVPLVPLHQWASSHAFWSRARKRFASAGVLIEDQLRVDDLPAAQARWQHLEPEPEHEKLIRELKASPEWPAIKARMEKEYGL